MYWQVSNDTRLCAFLSLIGSACTATEPEISDQIHTQAESDRIKNTDLAAQEVTIEQKFSNLNTLLDEIFYTTREELMFIHRKDQFNKPLPDVCDLLPYIKNLTLMPSDPNVKRLSYFVNQPNFFGYSLPKHNRVHFVNICTILWKYPQFVTLLQKLSGICKFHPLLKKILKLYKEKDDFQHFNRPYIDSMQLMLAMTTKPNYDNPDYKIKAEDEEEELGVDKEDEEDEVEE